MGISFGTTNLFGDVNNTGFISVAGNVTFWDDVDNAGTFSVFPGSTVVIEGTLSGAGIGQAAVM